MKFLGHFMGVLVEKPSSEYKTHPDNSWFNHIITQALKDIHKDHFANLFSMEQVREVQRALGENNVNVKIIDDWLYQVTLTDSTPKMRM